MGTRAEVVAVFADDAALAANGLCNAMVVTTPNYTHRAVLERLFDTGLHILCEKAHTPADAAAIAARAATHAQVFCTGMEYRYMPFTARFIARVHAGEAGHPVMLAMREHRFPFLVKVDDWNRRAANTGGTIVQKCYHYFDLMRLILRAEPVRVFCSGGQDVNHLDECYGDHTPDIIDNSYTVVDFANGTRAMLDPSMFAGWLGEPGTIHPHRRPCAARRGGPAGRDHLQPAHGHSMAQSAATRDGRRRRGGSRRRTSITARPITNTSLSFARCAARAG